jgi:hypothetical protein
MFSARHLYRIAKITLNAPEQEHALFDNAVQRIAISQFLIDPNRKMGPK